MGQFFIYQSRDDPNQAIKSMSNKRLSYIQSKFLYSAEEIINFHKIFRSIDKKGNGYVNIENLYQFLNEELNSVISPYLEYFFQLIDKEADDKITFTEWLPAISVYCLYQQDSVISFIFRMLDTDHDGNISKKDMMVFLVSESFGQKIFPYNYVKAVDYLDLERPHKITYDQFTKIQTDIPFLCYPAFRMQQTLQNKIFGSDWWYSLYDRIAQKENEYSKSRQLERMKEEHRKQQQNKVGKKIEKFILQTQNIKIGNDFFKKNREIRNRERCVSDSRLGAHVERPEILIESVYTQTMKQLKSASSQDLKRISKFNQVRKLHQASKSLIYIKNTMKYDIQLNQIKNQKTRKSFLSDAKSVEKYKD